MSEQRLKQGMVHVYTGNGKGKTTAALGLAFRAIGQGLNVHMIQFMKGDKESGEIIQAKKCSNFTITQFGRSGFVDRFNPDKIDIDFARKGLIYASDMAKSGECDLLILDEINVAVAWNLIGLNEVLDIINSRSKGVEIVLTGRNASDEIIEIGDYVTEMMEIKHPYGAGMSAREGIEY
ncbi:MAG: cob(I)yrinic acid a,c-diamide adenosyltransferase [Halobacteriota archaeon]|nr:cob(I)yrinic acid a,c-diamide adenosyltransferase [Halobacteriota archaeon]